MASSLLDRDVNADQLNAEVTEMGKVKRKAKARKAAQKGIAPEGRYIPVDDDTGNKIDLKYSIFPILRHDLRAATIEVIGTGFFITDFGVFLTARHVVDAAREVGTGGPYLLKVCQFLPGDYFRDRVVLEFITSDLADVAVGVCEQFRYGRNGILPTPSLRLSMRDPGIGENIVTYAYPDSVWKHSEAATHVHTNPHFYDGRIVEHFPNGRDSSIMTWPCFQTSMHIHGGASGGPVFDSTGAVFGINTHSFEPQTDVSYIAKIRDALPLLVHDLRIAGAAPQAYSLYDLARLGIVTLDPLGNT